MERKEHKAKVFRMCAFSGERLKVDLKAEYNQDMTALKAAHFDAMIKKLYDRYRPTESPESYWSGVMNLMVIRLYRTPY